MKSVGLITMHRVANHGSVLQSLATQKVIEQLGYNCIIIDYAYPTDNHLKRMGLDWYPHERNLWQLIKKTIRQRPIRKTYERLEYFYWFRKRFLKTTKKTYYSTEELSQNIEISSFDIYCVGSDQVWNPKYTMDDGAFVLDFVPKNKKKISYSSSFVVKKIIDDRQKEFYGNHLNMFNALSVREESGVNIIKELTGKDAVHVLDPVFLLTKEQWNKILGIKIKRQLYVFFYCLNYMSDVLQKMEELLEELSNKNFGLKILSNKKINNVSNVEIINDDKPQRFVEYIANASIVLTDSFHASAFALIYGLPVYSFVGDRNDGRIYSLFKSLGIQRNVIYGNETNKLNFSLMPLNIENKIVQLKDQSMQYLRNALEQEN